RHNNRYGFQSTTDRDGRQLFDLIFWIVVRIHGDDHWIRQRRHGGRRHRHSEFHDECNDNERKNERRYVDDHTRRGNSGGGELYFRGSYAFRRRHLDGGQVV